MGGKWGEMGGNGENHQQIRKNGRKIRGNGTKVGEKREGNGTEYPFSGVPKTVPTVPFEQIKSPPSPTQKWDMIPLADAHRPSGGCGLSRTVHDCGHGGSPRHRTGEGRGGGGHYIRPWVTLQCSPLSGPPGLSQQRKLGADSWRPLFSDCDGP